MKLLNSILVVFLLSSCSYLSEFEEVECTLKSKRSVWLVLKNRTESRIMSFREDVITFKGTTSTDLKWASRPSDLLLQFNGNMLSVKQASGDVFEIGAISGRCKSMLKGLKYVNTQN